MCARLCTCERARVCVLCATQGLSASEDRHLLSAAATEVCYIELQENSWKRENNISTVILHG